MFTGIVETVGVVTSVKRIKSNIQLTIKAPFAKTLKVNQSIAHNGVCLTVVNTKANQYDVIVVPETIEKSNLGLLEVGDKINLERSLYLSDRLDGHLVQGHVDQTAVCKTIKTYNANRIYSFEYDYSKGNITVEKGSICINGVSLTVVNSKKKSFSTAIIPYTFNHTNFKELQKGSVVNLEFDIIGKYISKLLQKNLS